MTTATEASTEVDTLLEQGPALALLTGPAGSGLSTALNALEDLGFEAIDNLPLSFLPRLLNGQRLDRPLALTLDVRNRDFDLAALSDRLDGLRSDPAYRARAVFLDCREDVLLRRFSETRRRHPFSQDGAPAVGIRRELDLIAPLARLADHVIDTSDLTPHDLRATIQRYFEAAGHQTLKVSVESFSFKRGTPQDLDTVFDVRFLRNPHWDEELRPLDGRDGRVVEHIAGDPRCGPFYQQVSELILSLLPAYLDEGKTHFAVGFGCTGGRHRSVALAEKLAATLAEAGWRVSIRHRGLGAEETPVFRSAPETGEMA